MAKIEELIKKKRPGELSKKRKSLQHIKDEIDELKDGRALSERFENKCFSHMKKFHKDCCQNHEISSEFQNLLLEAGKHHSIIKDSEKINDNLSILAYYLPQLKINLIRREEKTIKHITKKFIKNDTNIKNTISMIDNFKGSLDSLEILYCNMVDKVNSHFPLEDSVKINDLKHGIYLDKLLSLHKSQKELIYCIGKEFVDISNKLK